MMLFMPQSPRHLMNRNREEECLATLARLRSKTTDDIGVRVEFLEIKAAREFDNARLAEKFPQYQDGSFKSRFMIGFGLTFAGKYTAFSTRLPDIEVTFLFS